jgi:hypothetical protein
MSDAPVRATQNDGSLFLKKDWLSDWFKKVRVPVITISLVTQIQRTCEVYSADSSWLVMLTKLALA